MASTDGWIAINDYPGDQRLDAVPGTEDVSYWGEIGNDEHGRWDWTIVATNDRGDQWEVDGGNVVTEAQAKKVVEEWSPA
ncbi:hypothetical protein [Mycobacteroides abscessus]|uniref:hypothetical protein n=1 Tax=Mycobacteroides abscessus TaxID=36809 RepID=UPI000C25F6AA|nr:hypothetical protein [Mycobacteroides abscessus]